MQTLRKSYHLHLWYEHIFVRPKDSEVGEGERWELREGPMDLELSSIAEKELSYEEDRPRLLFLERQCRFWG